MKTLKDTKVGECVTVFRINGDSIQRHRLMEMGITKGTMLCVRRFAPLGDPMEISVRGYELSLRKSDAQTIEVI